MKKENGEGEERGGSSFAFVTGTIRRVEYGDGYCHGQDGAASSIWKRMVVGDVELTRTRGWARPSI